MIILLFLFVLNISYSIETENACWFVSGIKKDRKQAFVLEQEYLECANEISVNGAKCKCFDCWKDCKNSLYSEWNNSKVSSVTIINGTHGGKGGKVYCNAATESGEVVLEGAVNFLV